MAGVDVLCADKTGTITKNKISVVEVQAFEGFDEADVLIAGVLASREENHDPIDDAIIGRVRNSFSVYMDPNIQDPTGMDAELCFITQDMTKEKFEREFPNAEPISSLMIRGVGDTALSQWVGKDTVRVAEYFYKEYSNETLNLYPGNQTAFDRTPQDAMLRGQFTKPIRSRRVDRRKVMWMKTNGFEPLDEREWPGKWIPVVRVIGNEWEVDGKLHISGLVRNAKDAQRMYNYWTSQEAEMLALAPKAPFIGYGGQFEGYEQQWKTANTTNWPYLEVNPDVTDGAGTSCRRHSVQHPRCPRQGLYRPKWGRQRTSRPPQASTTRLSVRSPEDVDIEMRHLFNVLAGR